MMTEHEMEELLWNHPKKLLNEDLTPFRRQPRSTVGRADLVFTDRLARILVVELKKGTLPRGAIEQLLDYFGMLKREFPEKPVELMVVANSIPQERALACLKFHIEPREISEKKFRDVANEVGYVFESEPRTSNVGATMGGTATIPGAAPARARSISGNTTERAWYYHPAVDSQPAFLAFVNAKGSCSIRVFSAQDGAYLGKKYLPGDFQQAFGDFIKGAQPLSISRQPNLERECKVSLPSPVFGELKRQVRAS
ncbi:MAG: endonuclease NucS domain-containing protein [Candidatus Acidiferrales bacterium]